MTTILDCIGETPLVTLRRIVPQAHATIQAKLEFMSPTGSIKDRIAKHIILKAEREGRLEPGGIIIESTSGNTGAAVAMIAAARGYRAILVMPAKASLEKQIAARAMGAEVIVAPPDAKPGDPLHYVQQSLDLARKIPNSFRINQYDNLDNAEAHYLTTGPEIWRQTGGRIDFFVAAASTGGTLSGTARYLKEQNPGIRVVMPDPAGSIYAGYFRTGRVEAPSPPRKYQVEGVGKDHLVACMDFSVVDEVMTFEDADAFGTARRLAREEGILAGGSAGANVWASLKLAERAPGTAIVTVLPDSGLKYFSKFYDDQWLAAHAAETTLVSTP